MPSIDQLAPLPVVAPLLAAALLAAIGSYLPRRLVDALALLTTLFVLLVCCALVYGSGHQTIVYWFGNWRPDPQAGSPNHFPVGICFAIDPVGAGLAGLVALLATASFAFSWSYFQEVKALYHALMLVFVAAMCGLCLTGDLFNLFVWFELMTAAAVGLCGYKSEESWPLLGALNFAVVNTIGAFLSLGGVALLYAQTGSLNMAEVGRSLADHPPAIGFIMVAFLFVISGFLVKMAVVPFHFWLADAHAVAPTPVCVLFSGVMVELGIYAVARLHWLVFAPSLGTAGEDAVRNVFLLIGALTAVTGAIYCFGQRHLKRLLAFSTISHVGLMMIGLALLDPGALCGTAVYVLGHGMAKGALFLGAGILLHRRGSVDEYDLRGSGHNLKPLGLILAVGALALAGMPPFATFHGQSQIHQAEHRLGVGWLSPVTIVAEALTAGAVLRFTARVFIGWGTRQEATSRGSPHIPMDMETASQHDKTPLLMWLPAALLLVLAAVFATPATSRFIQTAAVHFEDPRKLAAATLDNRPDISSPNVDTPSGDFGIDNIITLATALGVAALALFPGVLGNRLNWWLGRGLIASMRPLRKLQSGNVGDYVAWFVFGTAFYGGLMFLWRFEPWQR
jgi:multicomponent Na+:H+ antiporter subunit D